MLLIGKENKEVKLKIQTGYEANNTFTRFLVLPVRDTSISAAQRTRSEEPRSRKIRKKLRNLGQNREKLKSDKEKFEEFQRENVFFSMIDKIVDFRMQGEHRAASLIQSRFRGYYYRKIYIQKLVDIGRETTKWLVKEMENFVTELFLSSMGRKSAVMIQKHWRRVLCQRMLKKYLEDIKAKILKEKNCTLVVQKQFRQFLSTLVLQKMKEDKRIETRLEYLKKRQCARKILRAMLRLARKAEQEREERKKTLTASSRKKLLIKMKKTRPFMRKSRNILDRIFKAADYDLSSPDFFASFSVLKRNRALAPGETSLLQTESSIIRRSVNVKVATSRIHSAQKMKNKEERKLKEIGPLKSNERSKLCKEVPKAPDVVNVLANSRKANWRVLKSNFRENGVKGKGSEMTSTRFTRSPSPNTVVWHKDGASGLSNRLDYY